eukprot:352201-Chlamydomonas_euryale.AAC.3
MGQAAHTYTAGHRSTVLAVWPELQRGTERKQEQRGPHWHGSATRQRDRRARTWPPAFGHAP